MEKINNDLITIKLNLNGGDYPDGFALPIKINKGESIALEKPKKLGFIFLGWQINKKLYNFVGKDDIDPKKLLNYEIYKLKQKLEIAEDKKKIEEEILLKEEQLEKILEQQKQFSVDVENEKKEIEAQKAEIQEYEKQVRKHELRRTQIVVSIEKIDEEILQRSGTHRTNALEMQKEELSAQLKELESTSILKKSAKKEKLKLAERQKALDKKIRKLNKQKRLVNKRKQIIVDTLSFDKDTIATAIWQRKNEDIPRTLEFREHEKGEPILRVRDLHISFRTPEGILKAVRGVDFDLNKGETLAIVGESGSGKSVTTRSIMGILAGNAVYERGCIFYNSYDMMQFKEHHFSQVRGSRIAMIFQDPMFSLNPIMKVGRQIAESLVFKKGMKWKDAKERAIELMEMVGIPEARLRYNQYPFQFSGGMRQRIVIAIALANDAEILIADEPTTALDVTIQAQILELIQNLSKKMDLSVIFITHDLGVVANVADRVAVMYAGRIVEYGKVDEIFYNPKHPYTWALLSSMPTLSISKDRLDAIPGTPPNMVNPPKGDAFAPRNRYALEVDFIKHPPFFQVSDTHYAATWLLDDRAPKITPPKIVQDLQLKWQNLQKGKKEENK